MLNKVNKNLEVTLRMLPFETKPLKIESVELDILLRKAENHKAEFSRGQIWKAETKFGFLNHLAFWVFMKIRFLFFYYSAFQFFASLVLASFDFGFLCFVPSLN